MYTKWFIFLVDGFLVVRLRKENWITSTSYSVRVFLNWRTLPFGGSKSSIQQNGGEFCWPYKDISVIVLLSIVMISLNELHLEIHPWLMRVRLTNIEYQTICLVIKIDELLNTRWFTKKTASMSAIHAFFVN